MQSVENVSRQTAAVAIRILSGEKSSDIKTPPIGFATPKFDWRQMQRWGVRESRLPPGSEIYFREPSPWQLYRWQIIAAAATMLLQAALIGWLIYEHRRRHIAEVQSRSSMAELTYMNRVASAGLLSASLAHEVNQPLAGIVLKANAALHWLVAENTGEVRKALTQIAEAGHRAAGIITNVKAMFSKDTQEKSAVSINELIRAVLGLVHIDLRRHRVETQISLDSQLPPVLGNEIQLQKVILNLVMNAIEAMRSTEPRLLSIKSKVNQHGSVHVSIEDTGSGIEPSNMDHLFKPLFTTKERGMGMGLSICQSIIESHGGKIWVASVAPRGSAFQFELPTGATTLTQPENGADSIA
jgi:C4-dicarboxylate-specific signal transduction histidine kinase